MSSVGVFRVQIAVDRVYSGQRCMAVFDAYENPIDVTDDVAQELADELVRLGRYYRATLLFDEERYMATDVLRTRGPSIFHRILRFFQRRK